MTTLGKLIKGATVTIPGIGTFANSTVQVTLAGRANGKTAQQPLDVAALTQDVLPSLVAAGQFFGDVHLLAAGMTAMTGQDDDAHEPCSLTACRSPLHPGPCKGWKHTLHLVSPGAYHQLEAERVRKANDRRLKRIAELKSQGKPIPRRLLTEIKPKPAPTHPVVSAQPLSQVGQKADLAGGQAHHAGQAVSNAAHVQVKTPPPLGPKQKKPTVAGRGPAFVITQPKVTDQYKLDKADKITPQEWAALSDVDKTTIRNELTAIKARGFGPQQTRADALLLKLYSPNVPGTAPQGAPGRVSLGQAVKGVSGAPSLSTPAAPASSLVKPFPPPAHVQHAVAVANRTAPKATMGKTHIDAYGKLSKAEFDALPADKQKTIRDDLANAKGKFLDPKKQQVAQDLLDRFGSSHPVTPPAAPGNAKGYSDPMTEAVKAAHGGGSPDHMLKTVARLSPEQVNKLDDADKKAVVARLAFTAGHKGATPDQKDRAAAYKRIIEQGSPARTSRTWDHEPSIGELHAEETKTGIARPHLADALKAADDKSMPRADRVTALTALRKPDFDALPLADQHKITDALVELHAETPSDMNLEDTVIALTGVHPAVQRMRAAEADYRAGKIDAAQLRRHWTGARVQSGRHGGPVELAKEAKRIAEDNPSLPIWQRAEMIDHPYSAPGGVYHSIQAAQNQYNFETAPRLSSTDISAIFRATTADLAAAHPIHAQAVKELRQHLIETGLRGRAGVPTGSPWSDATRNHVVDNFLHIATDSPDIPADRLAEFHSLPADARWNVERTLRDRIANQTSPNAQTATYITLQQLQGVKHTPEIDEVLHAAAGSFASPDKQDIYRKLDPNDYAGLPRHVRDAIFGHLTKLQLNAVNAGPVRTWTPQDNALKVFPAALADHLEGHRHAPADRRVRNATDIATYGQKIINPLDRIRAYSEVPISQFRNLSPVDQRSIEADLDSIAKDASHGLPLRYKAQLTKDIVLNTPAHLNTAQVVAIKNADPAAGAGHATDAVNALSFLTKADYDKLDMTYREAIDARIGSLIATHPTQATAFGVKFHPAVPPATPAGFTPTTAQTNVPPHVQAALDTIYGVHPSGKSHTMAHQLATYGALRGSDFSQLNGQEQTHLLGDLSFIATTAKGPSADKARKLIDRFTPAGTPPGHVPTPASIPPANAVPGQQRYATPLKGLAKAKDSGQSGDRWITTPTGRVWGAHGAAGMLIKHTDPATGEDRYLMVQRGPAISDPGKWTFPGGAIDSKETPHQGATRETIEELGLKDDQFKDAEVHGDFTYSIPGHPWKYTSVAVQVPQQFQPNLSTAHARAETSDAKWMTLAEIRALDKNGELHHPIANGALEKNVISLYPAAGRQTLGQIVRPGPVTKRQGRLPIPAGGRQAPASFNAWPHPHKQSKGKNLVPDKAAIDAQRQKIKNDRVMYDGKTADGRLAAIGAQQGFDDTPTVMSKKDVDRLLATGDYIEAWRGVSGAGGGWSARSRGGSGGKTAEQINEEMRTGPAYYGRGIFGNGYYLATQRRVAEQYSDHTPGSIVRILIPKTAVMQKYDQVEREAQANSSRTSKAKGSSGYETSTFWDPGRWGAAKGLDGIEIEHHHRAHAGGGASHVAQPGRPAYNWLNRSVLIVQKEHG